MKTRLILAFSNMIFSEGIEALVRGDKDISIIRTLKSGQEYPVSTLESSKPDVILTDLQTLYNSFPDLDKSAWRPRFLLVDTCCGMENLVSALLKKNVSGVLMPDADVQMLRKAVKAVAREEVWVDKQTIKNLLFGVNAVNRSKTAALADREKEIVALIGEGLRNKEIAQRLHISEPTVKTHLNRIFQKLNLKARTELMSYALKNAAPNRL
ncbi:MAG: response regulator transcription factor [Deltaproteobacteria bacterium]|nr:response regulator transcription factor [Deltaproteobacteria bacterium]